MYTLDMRCHQCMKDSELPTKLQHEIDKAEKVIEANK
jgi:hypothetical protein